MWSRIKKLYPIFATVVLLWGILAAFDQGPTWLFHDAGPGLLLMFAGVCNVVPGLGLPPIGPWWFIPFIMQFYAIWPLLRKLTKKFGWHGLLALALICLIITQIANPLLKPWSINLALTPLGRMRVFCFGIVAARYPIRINAFVALLALALIFLGNASLPFVPLASLSAAVFIIWAYTKVRTSLRKISFLETVGRYSLSIFLLNGIVRTAFVEYATTPSLQLLLACASFLVTFGISYVLQGFFPIDEKIPAKPRQVPALASDRLLDTRQLASYDCDASS
jgi:peptidoglycan/LPS O-acetylase OafA/YrhL